MHSRDYSHSFCLCREGRMPKKPPNEVGRVVVRDIQPHQTVGSMFPRRTIKVAAQTEERGIWSSVQNRNMFFVYCTPSRDFHTDDAEANAPVTQPLALACRQIFVE